jgi:hypothetical protein
LVRRFLRDPHYTALEFSENARLFLVSAFLSRTGFAAHQVLLDLCLT